MELKAGPIVSLTDGFDDGVLQRFLFTRGGFVFCSVVIVTSQLVIHTLPELSQKRIEHLQDCGPYNSHPSLEEMQHRQDYSYTHTHTNPYSWDGPTDPEASMTAASDRTSMIPALTEAGLLLLASR